jgi:hypothetical protein
VRGLAEVGAGIMHVRVEDGLGRCREAAPSEVRAAIYHVLRDRGWSLERIGDAFERDHSTVHHQVARSRHLEAVDEDHRYLVRELVKAAELPDPAHYVLVNGAAARLRAQIEELELVMERARSLRAELLTSVAGMTREVLA